VFEGHVIDQFRATLASRFECRGHHVEAAAEWPISSALGYAFAVMGMGKFCF
jgi:hypothetical protein